MIQFKFLPKVAIVGRPNVGKSTLFNVLTETRKSVVKNQSGVTRDILIHSAEVWGQQYDLIDTGGLTQANDLFSQMIREHVVDFLHSVDLILLVMDGRSGLIPEDRQVLRWVQLTGKPFIVLVNKIDRGHEDEILKSDFYELGVDLVGTSFEQRRGLSGVLEWLSEQLKIHKENFLNEEKPSENQGDILQEGPQIAIVGKPNVGKSSLVNALLGERRMMVAPIAGTTVDSVDTPFVYEGKHYTLVDTAGLRRKERREDDVEIISAFKSQEAIRRSNIILLVIDALEGPSEQDAKILETILEDHKGVLVVANKSDLAKKENTKYKDVFKEKCEKVFHFFIDIPIVFTSAEQKKGLTDLLSKVNWINEKLSFQIPTSQLNDFFFHTIRKAPSPVWGVNNVKFYYLTQTKQKPPSFIAFANHPDGVDNSYRRFIIKQLKEAFQLSGIPIRIFVMKSRSQKKE